MLVCSTYSFANVQDSSYCVGLTVFQCAIWRHREWDLRMRLSVILLFLVKWFELAKTYMYCFKNFLYSQRTTTFENSQLHPSRHQAREYHEMPETWWKVNLLCASESDIVSRLLIIFVEFIWAHLRGTDMRTHNTEFCSVLLYTIGAPGLLNITHDIQCTAHVSACLGYKLYAVWRQDWLLEMWYTYSFIPCLWLPVSLNRYILLLPKYNYIVRLDACYCLN